MTALAQEGAQLLDRMPSDDAVGLLEPLRDCSSPVAQYVQQLVADAQQQLMTDATRSSIPTDEASLAGDALETRLGSTTAASLMDAAVQAALTLEDGDVERQEDFKNLNHYESTLASLPLVPFLPAQVSPPSGVEGTAQVVVMPDDGRGVQGGGHEVRERVSEKERRGEGEAAHAKPMLVRLSSLVTPAVSCLEALTILEQQVAVAAPRIAAEEDQQDDRLGKGLAKKEQKEEEEKDIESDTSLDMAVFLAALEASAHEAVRFAIEGAFIEIEAALEHERERDREQEREQAKEQERQRKELVQVASQEQERESEQEQEQERERERNELVQAEAAIQRHTEEVVDWAVFRAIAEIQAAREVQREREESNFEWEREAEEEREVEREMERIRKEAQEREDREKEESEVERGMERLRQDQREERERHASEQKASAVIRSRAVEVVDLAICRAIVEIQAAREEERERKAEQEMNRIRQEEQEREDREKEAQILNSRVALYSTYTRALTFQNFCQGLQS
jgi:hypothetical protein